MQRILKLNKGFEIDEASIIVKDKTGTFRLPKGDVVFDQPFNPSTGDFCIDKAEEEEEWDRTERKKVGHICSTASERVNEQWPRGHRELESELFMLNAHGSFYEVGREAGYLAMRPVSTHNKKIMDFATWRGLLVLNGTKNNAIPDGHYFPSKQGNGL
jgi:hypothetical protein